MKFGVLLVLAACCAVQALGRAEIGVHGNFGVHRALKQMAAAAASGSQSSSAFATSSNVNGQQSAATSSSATGDNAITSGVSVAAGQIDTCVSGGPQYNAATCRTYAPKARSASCTDVPPDDKYSCYQQAVEYNKCNSDFITLGAFCLKSCSRCGVNCIDVLPTGVSSCDASMCDSDLYKSGPVCLKTCGRCSTIA